MDADDKWEKYYLRTLFAFIKQFNYPDIISYNFNIYKSGQIQEYNNEISTPYLIDLKHSNEGWRYALISDKHNAIWSKIIKSYVMKKSNVDSKFSKIKRGEDKLLTISCIENAENMLVIPNH